MVRIVEGFAARLDVPRDTCRKSGVQVFDDVLRGFGVRKYPDGRAYFFVKYSIGGKQGRHTLGSALERGGLKDARKEATRMLLDARAGRDPLAARKAAKAEHAALVNRKTLGAVIPEYLAAHKNKVRARTFNETARYLRDAWQPLHDHDLKDIGRRDVMERLAVLKRDSGARSADCAKAALRGLFAWSIDHAGRYCDSNPCVGIPAKAAGGGRDRVLGEGDLREIWRACRDDAHGLIVKLLLLTAARRGEIGGLMWDEIDVVAREIRLPRERCKNDTAYSIPLTDMVLALLPERREGHAYVFGRLPGAAYSHWSKSKLELDARIAAARKAAGVKKAMDPWCLHDLRRTACSGLQRLGVRLEVGEAILNHQSGTRRGVAGVYRRYAYDAEKREALTLWAARVAEIVR